MSSTRQTGQAAVESIGIAVLVALLLSATAAWLLSTMPPPQSPPDVIGRVAEPLGGTSGVGSWTAPSLPAFLHDRSGTAPVGRALRAVRDGVGVGVVTWFEARAAFDRAFAERIMERADEFLRDPLGDPTSGIDPDALTPRGAALAALQHAGALWDYGRFLRRLPARVAIRTAARDAGRLSADIAIEVGQALLRKRLMKGGTGPPSPRPGERAPLLAP